MILLLLCIRAVNQLKILNIHFDILINVQSVTYMNIS